MVSVVVLAAGLGTRMKSKTPKVLHKICGRSMIEYVIDAALSVSSNLHVVLFHEKELIKNYLSRAYPPHLLDKLHFHTQSLDRYPGTGGALMDSDKNNMTPIDFKGDRIVVLSGDAPLVSHHELERILEVDADIVVGICKTNSPHGYGRIVTSKEDSRVINRIVEELDCNEIEREISLVNGGLYCFKREILEKYLPSLSSNNSKGEFYLTDLIKKANEGGALILGCLLESKALIGVNSRVELAAAQDAMLDSLRLKAMKQGVTLNMPSSIYIDSRAVFEGDCIIENGACIRGASLIKDSHIKAHTVIEDSEIINSDIGPSAHIRPMCHIEDSHIGNFVECKKARLKGVKAGHLSYLGDCEIGEGSNVGAGVITCNYDGKGKHKTIIGKQVFIGSDTQLIAPVSIGDRVLIAAGSTVTKDAQSGDLVISRAKQVNHSGGYARFFGKNED